MTAYRFCRATGIKRFQPVYLSLNARATLSQFARKPIIESFRADIAQWVFYRDLNAAETVRYLGKTYLGHMR